MPEDYSSAAVTFDPTASLASRRFCFRALFCCGFHARAVTRRATMKRYIIERDLPGIGSKGQGELKGAAATSNDALSKLQGKAQWVQSFVTDNKTFCVYLAENEEAIREHARI